MAKWYFGTINITGGFLEGLTLDLPRGLTCIIGARGSGKSTLAEALRYGMLGISNTSKDRENLVQGNLSKSVVSINAATEAGTIYVVKRMFKQPPTLMMSDGTIQPGVDLDRGTFLPLDCYDSDEIEAIAKTLGEKRRSLIDELRADDLRTIRLAISEDKRALDANGEKITATKQVVSQLIEQIEEIGDVRGRLAALPTTDKTDANERLLAASRQQRYNAEERQALDMRLRQIEALNVNLTKIIPTKDSPMLTALSTPDSANHELLRLAVSSLEATISSTDDLIRKGMDLLNHAEQNLAFAQQRLMELHSTQSSDFAALQEFNRAASQAVNERSNLERLVAKLEEIELERNRQSQYLSNLLDERKQLKGDYLLSRERISDLREEEVTRLQAEVGASVRVRVLRNADNMSYRETLRGGLAGSGLRNLDELLNSLMSFRPDQFAQIIADGRPEELEQQLHLGIERSRKVVDAFKRQVNPLTLEIIGTDDQICIELNVSNGIEPLYKDASELSQGQKCTALLPLLLARRDTPLIIDQPEDNLDNHFIYETVVETINRVKANRQMIFITHNPNIPVLAEADLIVVMNSDGRTGHIAKQGSLDFCRDEIVDLLEGGQEAFELRRKRYAK